MNETIWVRPCNLGSDIAIKRFKKDQPIVMKRRNQLSKLGHGMLLMLKDSCQSHLVFHISKLEPRLMVG